MTAPQPLRLKPSINRFGNVHLFEQHPPRRIADDLDDGERRALREIDVKLESWRIRMAFLMLAPPLATLALQLFGSLPIEASAIYGMVPGYAFCALWWSRCPNCARPPYVCIDFCPDCGARALERGRHWPECTACGTVMLRFRSTPLFPRRHCSSCGLKLGRREPPVPAWLVPWRPRKRAR